MDFSVTLGNTETGQTLLLQFETLHTPFAVKWAQGFAEQIQRNKTLYENDRLYQFPNTKWTLETTSSLMFDTIEQLNLYHPKLIEFTPTSPVVTQEDLNHLHKYFEIMRGGVLSPAAIWSSAPPSIQLSINRFNILIHRLEGIHNAVKTVPKPRIVLTFNEGVRYPLEDEDYDHFTHDINFGQVAVNYCEVGKPLWDVFKDNDQVVGHDNIRPLRWYSADISIHFFETSYKHRINQFWQWWDKNNEMLEQQGFIKYHKKLAIGQLPVARLVYDGNRLQLLEEMSLFNIIKSVDI